MTTTNPNDGPLWIEWNACPGDGLPYSVRLGDLWLRRITDEQARAIATQIGQPQPHRTVTVTLADDECDAVMSKKVRHAALAGYPIELHNACRKHHAQLVVGEGTAYLKVGCHYPPEDTTRPCYPQPFEGMDPIDPSECVLQGWVDEYGAELLQNEVTINGFVTWKVFDADGPRLIWGTTKEDNL